jgi:hypothetical protein
MIRGRGLTVLPRPWVDVLKQDFVRIEHVLIGHARDALQMIDGIGKSF